MVDEIVRRIEQRVRQAPAMKQENKDAVLGLLHELKSQLEQMPESQRPQAESVVGFAALSAHEATKEQANAGLLKIALDGLKRSVEDFEQSHPRLVQIINAISTSLSNVGI